MFKTQWLRTVATGIVLALTLGTAQVSFAQSADLAAATKVVDDYLSALIDGDTSQISALIDGRMKAKSRQLVLSPDTYSQFLQERYSGVQTSLESIVPDDGKVRARVRFDYPTMNSSVIEFILTPIGGQWKITDEIF